MQAIIQHTPRLKGEMKIAGSKNYTSRYILAASLARGTSRIINPAPIDDAFAMAHCCSELGATVDTSSSDVWTIEGMGGVIKGGTRLNVRNAGAVTRFITAVCATAEKPVEIYTPYTQSLGKRPQGDLIRALQSLGADVASEKNGRLPIVVSRGNVKAGNVAVSGAVSSQYLTGLLFLTPLLQGTSKIRVTETLRSKPLIYQTLRVLREAGVTVQAADDMMSYHVQGPQSYQSGDYRVPGDWPSAAAILCAAAVTESEVHVHGLYEEDQGEARVLHVLRQMGVEIDHDKERGIVSLQSNGDLRPVEVDGDLATDAVLSMVAAACFANGTSHFYNLHTLRHKESDRISDFCRELRKCGVHVEEGDSSITVHGKGGPVPGGASIEAHHDHRIIMALTIIGLRSEKPITIHDIDHVAKSFPHFFVEMKGLGAMVQTDAAYEEHIAVMHGE